VDSDAVWDGEWGRSRDGCIRWGGYRRMGRSSFGVNLGRPIVISGDFVTRLLPNYFGQDLFTFIIIVITGCASAAAQYYTATGFVNGKH